MEGQKEGSSMKTWKSFLALIAILSAGAVAAFGQGASPRAGTVIVPDTNAVRPADVGLRAHTNYLIFIPARKPTFSSPTGETPGSLACVYGLVTPASSGCLISNSPSLSSGGSGIIAIVDAYDYPTARTDFDAFSSKYGLPTSANTCANGKPCFTKVYATGATPNSNSGWALEAALDIEWAHAMAPHAQIVLVEAASNSNSDLFYAVDVATTIVSTCNGNCNLGTGKGEVSMSWGGNESSGETAFDSHFNTPNSNVVYTAASGDSGGVVIYPSASPYVLSAGGTTIHRDNSGNFTGETAWSSSGGGPSAYESIPTYQSVISGIVGSARGTPDFSFDADPNSGVLVYDTTPYNGSTGWFIVGGTSVASPSLAGIINLAASSGGSFAADTSSELGTIYSHFTNTGDFTDITSGSTTGCSSDGGGNPHHQSTSSSSCFSAQTGWDFVTGVGTNLGTGGK
jgi:subtilase family serine protease